MLCFFCFVFVFFVHFIIANCWSLFIELRLLLGRLVLLWHSTDKYYDMRTLCGFQTIFRFRYHRPAIQFEANKTFHVVMPIVLQHKPFISNCINANATSSPEYYTHFRRFRLSSLIAVLLEIWHFNKLAFHQFNGDAIYSSSWVDISSRVNW